jgi:hypothetical protein
VPGPVRASFWIVLVSAALSALVAVIALVTFGSIVDQEVASGVSAGTIRTYLTVNIVLELLFAVVFVLLAFRVKQGSNWARVLLTVIVVVFALFDILGGTTLLTVVTILVELVAVALLYMPRSAGYFTPDKHRDPAAG